MNSPDPSKKSKVQTIGSAVVTIGSEAIGAALGAVAEQHQPGSGVAVKAGFSTFLRSSYSNISKIFSDREKLRVEVAVNSAEIKFQELENDGFERRNDEFFEEDSISGNSHAIEFFEGGLRAAMSAFQEQKVRFIGNLMGSIPFRKDIPIETAIQLVNIAKDLSYWSFVVLSLVGQNDLSSLTRRPQYSSGSGAQSRSEKQFALMVECFHLHTAGLVWLKHSAQDENLTIWPGPDDIDPKFLELSPLGKTFFELLALNEISASDLLMVKTFTALREISLLPYSGAVIDGGEFEKGL